MKKIKEINKMTKVEFYTFCLVQIFLSVLIIWGTLVSQDPLWFRLIFIAMWFISISFIDGIICRDLYFISPQDKARPSYQI